MGSRTDGQLYRRIRRSPAYRLGLVDFRDFEEFLVHALESIDSRFELLVLGRKPVRRSRVKTYHKERIERERG